MEWVVAAPSNTEAGREQGRSAPDPGTVQSCSSLSVALPLSPATAMFSLEVPSWPLCSVGIEWPGFSSAQRWRYTGRAETPLSGPQRKQPEQTTVDDKKAGKKCEDTAAILMAPTIKSISFHFCVTLKIQSPGQKVPSLEHVPMPWLPGTRGTQEEVSLG